MKDAPDNVERDPETLALFIEESAEALQRMEELLLAAEEGNAPADLMSTLFRDIHTIKGTSGFLALNKILRLSHVAEDLLALLRDKSLQARPEHFALLVEVVDVLRKLIDSVKETNSEGAIVVDALSARLIEAQKKPNDDGQPEAEATVATAPAKKNAPVAAKKNASIPPAAEPRQAAAATAPAPQRPRTVPPQAPRVEEAKSESAQAAAKPEITDGTVRVNVGVLDRLMNLIGELVLARNQIVQVVKTSRDTNSTAQAASQRLSLVTSDLQEQIMKTRMQPVARVFEKIPRMVRDLCQSTGKQVTSQIDGTATEIDKALVEAIRDPVLHIVRNAIDHGIEAPADRVANGKSSIGKLTVRASHEGGMVTIEIEDDGRGMDPKALRAHAIKKGLLSPAEADRLSDREAIDLVFRPGFSTATSVTDISGRGVGMDVVRTHIERSGGQVELDTRLGKGTTIRLKMPLTLAIIPALLVEANKQRFAIPQVNLLELVYLNEDQVRSSIEHVRGAAIYRLRGEILPLVKLGTVLGVDATPIASSQGVNIVVVAAGGQRYGLVVDAIHDTEEIVIKPLHSQLKRLACYAGATVLGDGGVALILEVTGIAAMVGIDPSSMQRQAAADKPAEDKSEGPQPHVVFRAGEGTLCAVPLAMVARLEQIQTTTIERLAENEVVQYRNSIMPIVRPEAALPLGKSREATEQPMLVFDFGHMVGMAVAEIVDVVDVSAAREGGDGVYVLGKTVVMGKTALLLDVYRIVRDLAPRYVLERRRSQRRSNLLLVDSSNAMRTATASFLRARGYDVSTAEDGESALRQIREATQSAFAAVITDLELKGINGIQLIESIRKSAAALPIIAWSDFDDAKTLDRTIEAGATTNVSKLDRDHLLKALADVGAGQNRRASDEGAAQKGATP